MKRETIEALGIETSKYTRWARNLTADQLTGLLWLVGEFALRSSVREFPIDQAHGGDRRKIAALRALIEFDQKPLTEDEVMALIRHSVDNRGVEQFVTVAPIRPDEVVAAKLSSIPDAVISVFNDLIAKKISHGSAKIYQEEVVAEIVGTGSPVIRRQEIFDNNLLDVEDIYRNAGWRVVYEKPERGLSDSAFFLFSKRVQNP